MSKTMRWNTTILVLGLLALVLIGWNVMEIDSSPAQAPINTIEPTYQSEYTTMVVYNKVGGIQYKLIADQMNYFSESQITWLTQPIATTFDEKTVPIWILKADKAKLTQDKKLYLYGHVQMDILNDSSHPTRITTNNTIINLVM
ncbi:LPS export ABC transporter periplasmic protein LptC [Sodalis endosymbiont of Henestaris halophilus]|nr:Lipopolysaccharide export system protein LptC [Sodalis endosymbiont of Henestaris halophilus]